MENQLAKESLISDLCCDTWEMRGDTATWYIILPLNFTFLSYKEINAWYQKTVIDTFNSFTNLARVRKVYFTAEESTESVELEWKSETSYEQYYESLLRDIEDFSFTISFLDIYVDFNVFVRTIQSPQQVIRTWVRYFGKFSFCGGRIHSKPFVYLDIDHTLFCPSDVYGGDNTELYYLNQPLLETALRSWEQKIGKINEVDGIEGIYEYGFLPDEDD